jgi:hypothetical protein
MSPINLQYAKLTFNYNNQTRVNTMICFRPSVLFALILLYPTLVFGDSREAMISAIDDRFEQNLEIALSIWELAELGYGTRETSTGPPQHLRLPTALRGSISEESLRMPPGPRKKPVRHSMELRHSTSWST